MAKKDEQWSEGAFWADKLMDLGNLSKVLGDSSYWYYALWGSHYTIKEVKKKG